MENIDKIISSGQNKNPIEIVAPSEFVEKIATDLEFTRKVQESLEQLEKNEDFQKMEKKLAKLIESQKGLGDSEEVLKEQLSPEMVLDVQKKVLGDLDNLRMRYFDMISKQLEQDEIIKIILES